MTQFYAKLQDYIPWRMYEMALSESELWSMKLSIIYTGDGPCMDTKNLQKMKSIVFGHLTPPKVSLGGFASGGFCEAFFVKLCFSALWLFWSLQS